MKAMILAAGEGVRLRPLTNNIPKVMVKIDGKPLLEHNVNLVRSYGVREIITNVHYKPEIISNYFQDGDKFGVSIFYSKEKELLGSAGGIKKVANKLNKTFFVLYGDNLSNCNLKDLLTTHKKNKTICTLVIFDKIKNKNTGKGGGRILLNKDKTVRQFIENGEEISNFCNAGIYVLEPEIFKYIPNGKKFDFGNDVFPLLLKRNIKIGTYKLGKKGYLYACDTMKYYRQTQDFFKHNVL
ncbi:MAG: nucleotidyltransferase family protein [Patescibacteria group bacterium]|jgi:NDP-sugar pyrophosphorylase family protein